MFNRPFLLLVTTKDNDSMKLSDKGHKLSPYTRIQKNRSNFVLKYKAVIDNVFISNCSKIEPIFFNKNPFILFDRKPVYKIEFSLLVFDLYFFDYFTVYIDVVYFIST